MPDDAEILQSAPDRPFLLKLRKGSSLHRFKIKMVGVQRYNIVKDLRLL